MTDAYRFDESSTEKAIAYAKIYAGTNSPAMETVLKVAFSENEELADVPPEEFGRHTSIRLHEKVGGGIPGRI